MQACGQDWLMGRTGPEGGPGKRRQEGREEEGGRGREGVNEEPLALRAANVMGKMGNKGSSAEEREAVSTQVVFHLRLHLTTCNKSYCPGLPQTD